MLPRLQLQAGIGASYNYWHSRYQTLGLIISSSSRLTRFAMVEHSDSDHFLALELSAGLAVALSSRLEATLEAGAHWGDEFSSQQFSAGLRYTLR